MSQRRIVSRLWLPALAGMLGLLGTLALWYALREHDAEHVRRIGRIAGLSIQNDMEADLNAHFLSELEALSPSSAGEREQQLWTSEARLFMKLNPAFVGVAWFDAGNQQVWSTRTQAEALPIPAAETVRDFVRAAGGQGGVVPLSLSAPLPQGERLRQLVVPIRRDGSLAGFVVAWVRLTKLLDVVLDDASILGYCISIHEAGNEIYRVPNATAGCEQPAEFVEVRSAPLNWHARIWPAPELAGAMRSKAPSLALLLGSCFSLLLGFTVYFAESVQMRNASLTAEIAHREQAQAELRRAHTELEARVEARTAELARSEATLSKVAGELLEERDRERRRVAQQLQESTAQNLAALAVDLAIVEQLADPSNENVRMALQRSTRLLQQSCDELGDIAAVLHPPILEHLGLAPTIHWYVTGVCARRDQKVTLQLDPNLGRLSRQLELALFRMIQEGLSIVCLPDCAVQLGIYKTGEHALLEIRVQWDKPFDDQTRPVFSETIVATMRQRAKQLDGVVTTSSDQHTLAIRVELPWQDAATETPPKA